MQLVTRLNSYLLFATLAALAQPAMAQSPGSTSDSVAAHNAKMAWWRDARFGMFIHWGVYSVPAGRYDGKEVPGLGEWIMHDARIPRATYQQFATQFNPVNYDPDAWVRLAKEAGVRYIVITSKHHDGFAMFNSKASDWNIVQRTPYGKDVLAALAASCRKYGMRLGFYYSQANDWNNPGGAAYGGHWDSSQNGSMDDYISKVAVPQVREILTHYGKVSELWFDVPTGMTPARASQFLPLLALQPGIVVNNRLGGGFKGDIETPEQYIPATGIPGRDWETCMTMNDTWGYKSDDNNWKSSTTLIRNLVDIASKGGNYLLNVGPKSDGTFPEPIVERLQAIGRWMKVNSESIYGTSASPFPHLDWGRCTRKAVPGGEVLYLQVFDWPTDGKLLVPGLHNSVVSARLLSDGSKLTTSSTKAGVVVNVPSAAPDSVCSVIRLEVHGKVHIAPVVKAPVHGNDAGVLNLKATDADLHPASSGEEGPQVEGDPGSQNIGYWTNPASSVSWDIRVAQPGTYAVTALVATPADSSRFSLHLRPVPGPKGTMTTQWVMLLMRGTVYGTGSYGAYKEEQLGTVKLSSKGTFRIEMNPAVIAWNPINLRTLEFVQSRK